MLVRKCWIYAAAAMIVIALYILYIVSSWVWNPHSNEKISDESENIKIKGRKSLIINDESIDYENVDISADVSANKLRNFKGEIHSIKNNEKYISNILTCFQY